MNGQTLFSVLFLCVILVVVAVGYFFYKHRDEQRTTQIERVIAPEPARLLLST